MSPKYSDGTVRQKGNTYEYRFFHEGKQYSVCGKTEEVYFAKRTDIICGKNKTKKNTPTYTMGEYFKQYYATFKVRKDGTKINIDNELIIDNIIYPRFKKLPLKAFTATMAKEFLREYDDRPNRRRKIYILLNEVFKMALAEQLVKVNPIAPIKLERYEVKNFNAIQPSEQNIILANLEEPYLTFFWYLCCTGFRLDTAIKAVGNIDLKKCTVTATKKDTTTKKHKSTIPFLPGFLDEESVKLLKQINYNTAEKYYNKLFKDLGLDLVLHSCRKTFASCAYHVGFSDKWIQDKLSHSAVKTTMDLYVSLIENTPSPLLNYFRRLKEYLGL